LKRFNWVQKISSKKYFSKIQALPLCLKLGRPKKSEDGSKRKFLEEAGP